MSSLAHLLEWPHGHFVRRELLRKQLEEWGVDTYSALRNRQLVFFDARNMLGRIMSGGQPDWLLFESAIGAAIQDTKPANDDAGLRVYGEMVGVLWKAGTSPPR